MMKSEDRMLTQPFYGVKGCGAPVSNLGRLQHNLLAKSEDGGLCPDKKKGAIAAPLILKDIIIETSNV